MTGYAEAVLQGNTRQIVLNDLVLEGDTIRFWEVLRFGENEIRIDFTGKISEDSITFYRRVGDAANEPAVAKRVEKPKPSVGETTALSNVKTVTKALPMPVQPDPDFHIFLCFGQSNMESGGTMTDEDRKVDERFFVLADFDHAARGWQKNHFYHAVPPLSAKGRGICLVDAFGKTLVGGLPTNVRVGVVKVAVPGCKIELFQKDHFQSYIANERDWMKNIVKNYGDNPYQYLVDMAKEAQKYGVIRGILLHQGESNANDQEWPNKVKSVYDNLIADLNLNPEEVPLLAGELVHADQQGVCAAFNDILARLPKIVPTAHVIPSSGCATDDRLHFNSEGSREFGKRYGETMLSLIQNSVAVPQ